MPNNVKSYKKIDEKAQTAKITVFAMGSQLLGVLHSRLDMDVYDEVFEFWIPGVCLSGDKSFF